MILEGDPSSKHASLSSRALRGIVDHFRPPFETARHYSLHKFRKDILAGLTVSVVEVPQAMAYAIVAGVPPQYGLYTSVIQGIIGSLLSSSEHMTTGPTNTQSLLIASAVHRLVSPTAAPEHYLQLVFALAMLKGIIQLAFAAARMGNMVRYVSRSVIVGLVSGAGFLIFFGQLPALIGIHSKDVDGAPGIIGPIQRLVAHVSSEFDWWSLMIGLGAIAIIVSVRLKSRFLPGSLVAIVLAAFVAKGFGLEKAGVPLLGELPRGFPKLHNPWPGWVDAEALLGGALALAIIGMLESVSIAKAIAARTGETIDANQEFFAQGLKNFTSSFLQCIPGSGSFTRSALDYEAGAETRFAAVFNACFVAVIFWLGASQARFIPRSALAGVLIVIAVGLVDWRYLPRTLKASRADFAVCIITFLATLFVPLEYAIFVGVFLNIALYLRVASRLHLHEMVRSPTSASGFLERDVSATSDPTPGGGGPVVFLQVEGDLFFGVADELHDRLAATARRGARIVILRLRRTHSIDVTALHVLERFVGELAAHRGQLLLCGVSPNLLDVMKAYGLIDLIGAANVFPMTDSGGVFASAKQALRRAEQLVGKPVEEPTMRSPAPSAWAYEI